MNKMQHKFSWQTPNWLRVLCLTLLVSVTSIGAYAQTIATTLANNNGSGVVIGNLYNSNAFPILINTVHCAISTATTQNFQLWTKAVAGPNVGAPGAVSAANGWTLQATQSVTSTAATSTALTGTACPVVLSGLNVSLDANTYYLICIGATSINYSTIGTQTCSFTSGGVTLTYCTSNGYGGTFAAPGNTPRGLVGAITFSPAVACSGTPTPGNTLASATSACPSVPVTFSLQNNSGTGVTYQWYNNSGAISGATNATYITTITATDDYYCDVTCTSSGLTASSSLVNVTPNSFFNCYCPSSATSAADEEISNVTFGTLNNTSGCATLAPGPGSVVSMYSNYKSGTGAPTPPIVSQLQTVPFSVTQTSCGGNYTNVTGIYIDFNQNGSFTDAGENVFTSVPSVGSHIDAGNILIPLTASVGLTAMRIVNVESSVVSPCGTYTWGETEDYLIDIVATTACTGTPTPGNTVASQNPVCPNTNVVLTLSTPPVSTGNTFQWYNNSGPISGATNDSYTALNVTAADDYYCDVTCTNSGLTASSNILGLTMNSFLNCYCAANSSFGTSGLFYGVISNVTFNTLNNSTSAPTASPYYTNYTPLGTSVDQGSPYPLSVTLPQYGQAGVWCDWDQNGIFDASEFTFMGNNGVATPTTYTQLINVPVTAVGGVTRMRVRSEAYFYANLVGTQACGNTNYGETEDYEITVVIPTPCTGAPAPGNTTASATSVCPGTVVNFGIANSNNGTGISYQWYNNSGAIAGATNAFYSQAITAVDDFWCDLTCVNSGLTTSSNIIGIGLNPFLNCYCVSNATTTADEEIYNVTVGSLNNTSTCASTGGPGSLINQYSDYTTVVAAASLTQLQTVPFSVQVGTCGGNFSSGIAIFIDYDHNGIFDVPAERVYSSTALINGPYTQTGSFIVPITAMTGITRMRVVNIEQTALPVPSACAVYGYGETEDYLVDIAASTACSGTPAPGTTLASASTVCSGGTINFSLSNTNLGSGSTFQWYNNAGPIAGATNAFYSQVITASDAVYCDVTCTNSSLTAGSTPVSVGLSPFYTCYCASAPTQAADEEIYQVTLNGASTDPLYANANGCATVAPGPGSVLSRYSNFTTLGNLTTITQGNTVTFEIRQNECDGAPLYANGIGIWIDFNQNGVFTDPGEAVYIEATTSAATGLSPAGDKVISGSFVVPISASLGSTTMRVISAEGVSGAGLNPCLQYGYGETEDHLIDIAAAFACSGTPAPGNTIASVTSACPGSSVNFSIQNNVGSGITYQWYNNGGAVAGATNATYTQVITAADNVYCDVTCTNSSLTAGSTPVAISIAPFFNCYCVTGLGGSCGINAMSSVDIATTTLNNVTGGCTGTYNAFPASGSTTATIIPGTAYTMNVGVISGSNTQVAIWIDENQNGIYETSEYTLINGNIPSGGSGSGTFTVPVTALSGNTGMRVRSDWQGTTAWTSADACTNRTWGETEDYVITIVTPTACSGTPAASNTVASLNPACVGNTTNLSLSTVYTETGITYQWYNGAGAIAGATNATYVATITAADNFYCDITCTNSSVTTSSTPVSITLNTFINCYCAAGATTGCANGDEYVGNFTLNTINNSSTCGTSTYSSYTTISTNLAQGQSYTASVLIPNWFGGDQASVWIDFNQDGTLDDITERFDLLNGGGSGTTPLDGTITVPVTALTGPTLCRVRGAFTGTYTACGNTSFGEVEDYVVVIDPVATNTVVSLNLFIEGFWDGSSAMLPVLTNQGLPNPTTDCDDITVELYNSAVVSPIPAPDYTTAAMLHTDGTATATFTSAITGNYYIVIKHRNALQTWSAAPVAMGPAVSYNFTTAASQAYGSNQVEIATGVFALYSGDVAIDENMDLLDLGLVETDISNFGFGYLPTDLNGDGNVDLLDSPIVETNISNFIFSSHP